MDKRQIGRPSTQAEKRAFHTQSHADDRPRGFVSTGRTKRARGLTLTLYRNPWGCEAWCSEPPVEPSRARGAADVIR